MVAVEAAAITTPDTGIQEAAEVALGKASEGEFDFLIEFATVHLGPRILFAALGLIVLFIGYLTAKYLARVISKPVCRRVDETLGKFVGRVIFYGVMLAVGGAVLSELGVSLGGLAAMLAAVGFAVGLAFQGTLSNFAAGVLMLVFRPFKVGDVINAAGVLGKVNEIDLFTTTLDTADNRRIIVPNNSISSGTIENVSYHPHRRVEVIVGVQYTADMMETRQALEAAIASLESRMIVGKDRGSAVVMSGLGDHSVQWKVRMWVAAADYWPMLESLTCEVKKQLDAVNIGIPFPQLEVHFDRGDAGLDVARHRPRIRPVRRAAESLSAKSGSLRAS